MSWKPNLSDEEYSIDSKGTLLEQAIKKAVDEHKVIVINSLKDKTRKRWGFVTDKCILVARGYIYGDIISVHAESCALALNQKKPVVVYIQDVDKFYAFDPAEIIDNSETNYRRGIAMMNFSIRLGKRWD